MNTFECLNLLPNFASVATPPAQRYVLRLQTYARANVWQRRSLAYKHKPRILHWRRNVSPLVIYAQQTQFYVSDLKIGSWILAAVNHIYPGSPFLQLRHSFPIPRSLKHSANLERPRLILESSLVMAMAMRGFLRVSFLFLFIVVLTLLFSYYYARPSNFGE